MQASNAESTESVVALRHELQAMIEANRTGSDSNNRLAGLASAAVLEQPSVATTLEAHGLSRGEFATHFRSELTIDDMRRFVSHCFPDSC
eukprot:SAG11_NODE_13586_length_648_cov_1.981785_1_plen_90_part_00